MRLVEVELEDYKHYAGTHCFRPGERAMVAVIGPNGAGKTTLFEAIEWCLYNPSHIRNDSLIPRNAGGKPRVRVVLEDAASGIVYEIERSLKGGSTKAEIYRTDQPESPLVQGTKQVTEYVTRELTGLPHAAFVSTFFTKQKELSFFGDMGATERREQVGRLLGLETIRVAQKSIGERRAQKLAEAHVKRVQYEEQSRGIDFPVERARLDGIIIEQMVLRDQALADEAERKQATAAAAVASELVQQRFALFAGLQQQHERVTGDQRRFTEMHANAERELTAIAEAEKQIGFLQEEAAREPIMRARIEQHDSEKKKQDESVRLTSELSKLFRERQQLEAALDTDEQQKITGKANTIERATSIVSVFGAVIDRIAAIDLEARRTSLADAKQLVKIARDKETSETKLANMEMLAAQLTAEFAMLVAGGLPADRLARIQEKRAELRQQAAVANSSATQTEHRMHQLRILEQSLRASEFGELCPTCARPFQPGEATKTLDALSEQIHLLATEVTALRSEAARANAQSETLEATEQQLQTDVKHYQELAGRLQKSAGVIENQQREVAAFSLELGRLLREAKRQEIPAQPEIDLLQQELVLADTQIKRKSGLEAYRAQLLDSIERQQNLDAQRAVLGTIAYDPEAHRRDYAAWEITRDAVARIEELTKRATERPHREATIARAKAKLIELANEIERIETEIGMLDYADSERIEANLVAQEALERERTATSAAHAAQSALDTAQRARTELDTFEARLRALNEESVAAQLAHSELSRVYSEFARFEKFVARVVTPQLSEIASGLLSTVTEGKYEQLEFTEDYGIVLGEGDEDVRFPLSQYSGGERDVMALCARLALSQMIGGQAATPLQFMVLDEVFGSLDIDRRRNLMEMLQRLMEEHDAFRQLFVISHVDDVKTGAMFDEIWRVSETADGISQLEQVSLTGSLEDY